MHNYVQLPADSGKKTELIERDGFLSPSPNRFHQKILGRLFGALWNYLQANPIGEVYASPSDVTLTDLNVDQPALCYFYPSRFTSLTEHGADGAPDLVVEILSPSSAGTIGA